METPPTRAERRAATAAKILDAAQEEFAEQGLEGGTIRGIARRAGVDPSLVLQHYGSKQKLFALAVQPAPELERQDVPAHLAEVLDVRLRELPAHTRALLRSMLTSPEAAAVMRDYLQERVDVLARAGGGDEDARTRAAVLVSSILGMTIARHFLGLADLERLDADVIARVVEPWFDSLS
ncbi:TetR family transcriptional regulator [uncultured Leifsonia sp.]|uniref:TetR/AcrR family transcriptional regulator n=1 Tax=uncultured Leifsonia sp. TaxID=340359 RepID=UPI0028D7E2D4|nr:TetR family transcriptional regulator [uncultured Leifsonia sp.]